MCKYETFHFILLFYMAIRKLFTHQALERSEQNFVTKLNHVPHLAWGLYYMSMPNGVPPVRSQGAL